MSDLSSDVGSSDRSYIATKRQSFDRALAKHREAKAQRKRAETGDALRRAGRDLSFAVGAMKQRLETEQKEAQLFIVDDQIMPPHRFSKHLSVRVSYRWRRTVDDEWAFRSEERSVGKECDSMGR